MSERTKLLLIVGAFLACFYLPLGWLPSGTPIFEAFALVKWYAREHVLLCLIPSFFIAGAISVFVSQAAVMKYFGAQANKFLAYGVASISGAILAVCSCTVLPIFGGIYKRGAGLGPATAFLYSGPAINVLAIILTARILGWQLGLARAIGAVLFSLVVGALMHVIFLKEERARHATGGLQVGAEQHLRPLWKNALTLAAMVGVLVFANWGKPQDGGSGLWAAVYESRWVITIVLLGMLASMLVRWFERKELRDWTLASWGFAKQILPLLLFGVFAAGLLLGRPGYEGLIPSRFIAAVVGGNSLMANLTASVVGALMYFATLTEIPILQGLLGSGMGNGPALVLLLAGPALSLPNILVIRSMIGTKKVLVYAGSVVVMATITGLLFGAVVG